MNLKKLISISRPRFWLYLAGPYLVGYTFGTGDINSLKTPYFLIHFFYFLIPANILLYGINDLFDTDTDSYNQKKGNIEHLLLSREKSGLVGIILICLALTFFLLSIQISIEVQLLLTLFIFLSAFYSAPPLRFKAQPIIDFSSNILYAIPALIAYFQTTNNFPPLLVLVAIFCWTSAMHLFSAVPDIIADKKAYLRTTAVIFGKHTSLIICLAFWLIAAGITIIEFNNYLSLISLLYPLIPLILLLDKQIKVEKVYWYFPKINTLIGFLLFLKSVS